ncbi:M20 metallopeptidase family protein [Acetivibrio mesophilus]|uniref:Amidohydrolase n=1 Tax=Acetivibrio mesophilus TaxID=2487273 RepID=A0A4V1K1X1_9FIRM|nr:amidohydrolase [Acetivibrio mesophilus]ODM26707.1 hypothetical protein A7W90_11055 [Clostridium sp. Bc-iso-3]RXE58269.1 amidohydrolase [Acetivibrio mesophilus]HHV30579.1 amidohydrolase [Clostridium sp.]HOA79438.1 amidohydrolase [Defluviitaleaceae bacterium]
MKITNEVYSIRDELLRDKNFFNCNPELGYKEFKTSKYISSRLKEIGFQVEENIATTGVVAVLKGKQDSPCIMFRADMDAVLTIPEETTSIMHACGHDAHMAILLGLASLLAKDKHNFKGTVKLVFQPGEEGFGGAEAMIHEGVLDNPKVDKAFALHVWSELDEDCIGIKDGPIMASGDEFEIEVYGKGGHAALPEKCSDSIYIASQIVVVLQSIVSRNISPIDTAVVSVTSFNGGCNYNTICEKVAIRGTCRTFRNETRELIASKIKEISTSIASSLGGKAIVKYRFKHPPVVNWKEESNLVAQIAELVVGKENIITNYSTMCTEDFSHFLRKVPGALVLVGCKGEEYWPQHSPNFYVGEKPMLIGLELLYGIARKYLSD